MDRAFYGQSPYRDPKRFANRIAFSGNPLRGSPYAFLNKIYLYDDKFRLVLNGSGQPVEIDNIMLDEIDDYFDSQISDSAECSSMVADAPPFIITSRDK